MWINFYSLFINKLIIKRYEEKVSSSFRVEWFFYCGRLLLLWEITLVGLCWHRRRVFVRRCCWLTFFRGSSVRTVSRFLISFLLVSSLLNVSWIRSWLQCRQGRITNYKSIIIVAVRTGGKFKAGLVSRGSCLKVSASCPPRIVTCFVLLLIKMRPRLLARLDWFRSFFFPLVGLGFIWGGICLWLRGFDAYINEEIWFFIWQFRIIRVNF